MNIKMFEAPKEITLKEAVELLGERKHPICKFEYGDFDNFVEAVISSLDVSLDFTKFAPNSIYGPKWCVSLKNTWKYLYEVEKAAYWRDAKRVDVGYSDHYLEHVEDIFKNKIKIIGVVEEY